MKVKASEIVAKLFFVAISLLFIIIGICVPRTEIEKIRAMFPLDLTNIGSIILSIIFSKFPWYIVKMFLISIGFAIITLIVLVTFV
jgi:hypothetical protein